MAGGIYVPFDEPDYTSSGYLIVVDPNGEIVSQNREFKDADQALMRDFIKQLRAGTITEPGVYEYTIRQPEVRVSIRLLNSAQGSQPGTPPDTEAPLAPAGVYNDSITADGFTTHLTANSEPDIDHYNVYRSLSPTSGFAKVGEIAFGSTSYDHTGLTAGVTYYVKLTAVDNASPGNESEFSSVVSATPQSVSWDTIPDQIVDSSYPNQITGLKTAYLNNGTGLTVTVEDRPITGNDLVATGVVSYDDATDTLTVNSDPGGKQVFLRAASSAQADWESRIAGAGVVWYHDFRNQAEVDNFRWGGGIGNDPQDASGGQRNANTCRWITTDGITGGGCLELFRFSGSTESKDWWRPLSPMDGTGNGRGSDDPGASGTIPVETWAPTQGGSQTAGWRNGTYGPSSTGTWDGDEFYVQMWMKLDSRRRDAGVNGGKIHYLTRTEQSLVGQELVTYYKNSATFSVYKQGGLAISNELSDVAHVWDEWANYLYHIVPGDENVANGSIEVWRALQGETSYTKIFQNMSLSIDYQDVYPKCWNALLVAIYHNGINIPTDFYQRYDQIIFSTQYIPCPQA